jgi:hypothetical protein
MLLTLLIQRGWDWKIWRRVIKGDIDWKLGLTVIIGNIFPHFFGNILVKNVCLDHRDGGCLNGFEVLDETPLLDLVSECVQVIDHVISVIDPHSCHCNVHVT